MISHSELFTNLRIYRKCISNLKIRDDILHSISSIYTIGPTIIWTEDSYDLSIFTVKENYKNYIGFDGPFSNPSSKKYLKKQLKKMRMVKGTILIKESTNKHTNTMDIPVHFCAYRVDKTGKLIIFDPSWHRSDPGIYSTTVFYDSLDAFGISYTHAESMRTHHWQSLLPNDVFCQTWTLQWLIKDTRTFPLPKTSIDAAKHIANYIKEFTQIILNDVEKYMSIFPIYKLEGNDPVVIFHSILQQKTLIKTIHRMF